MCSGDAEVNLHVYQVRCHEIALVNSDEMGGMFESGFPRRAIPFYLSSIQMQLLVIQIDCNLINHQTLLIVYHPCILI